MKRGLKIGGGLAVVLIVVLAVVFYFLFTSLGPLIVAAVESFGSEATQAKVELNEAEVSMTSGEGALRGLSVGNREGFATDSAIRLGAVSLMLDLATVASDPVVVKEIVVQAPEVTYELGEAGSNIDALQRNVESYAKRMSGGDGGQGSGSGGGAGSAEAPKLIIENLYVRDGKIEVSATALGGKTLSVPLPTIHLKDIGKDTGGATPDQVMAEFFASITGSVGKAVAPLSLDKLTGAAEGAASGAKDALEKGAKDAGDKIKKLLGN
jgi:hypothetical protein